MNQYLIDKLREGRLNKGLKQSDVTKLTGIKNTTLSNYENGNTEPDMDTFLKLCNLYELDYAEIIREAYGYCIPGSKINILKSDLDYIKKYRSLDSVGREIVDYVLDREVSRSQRIEELEKRPAAVIEFNGRSDVPARVIQYFHSVSAGTGQVLFDDVYSEGISIPDIPEYSRVAYAVKVTGRSMEPLYYDGDMLLIEPSCEIEVGEIGIFNVNGQAYVKKLGENELISVNEGYGNITLEEDSRCMGRVVDKFTI